MNFKRILSVLFIVVLCCSIQFTSFAAMVWDNPPPKIPQNTNSTLIDMEITAFKGDRIEYTRIPFDQAITAGVYNYEQNICTSNLAQSGDFKDILIKPIAYDEKSTFLYSTSDNPTQVALDFNIPFRLTPPALGSSVTVNIQVTSADKQSTSTYTLKINNKAMKDEVKVEVIEENLAAQWGIYRFTSINGFVSAEDCYMFAGKDKAILFDALNGGSAAQTRGGNLKREVYNILQNKLKVTDNPDNFRIDVAITHNNGDHYGMINDATPAELRFASRGTGLGTVYYPLEDCDALSVRLFKDPKTDLVWTSDGDKIVGPKFDGVHPLTFEVVEVPGHTPGCSLFLYDRNSADNKAYNILSHNYLMGGDAIGSGSYVFTFGGGKQAITVYNSAMKKLWDRVKNFDDLTILSGHSWQERIKQVGKDSISYIEDMYIATSKVLENPLAGIFTTRTATAGIWQMNYGMAGFWYDAYAVNANPADLYGMTALCDDGSRNLVSAGASSGFSSFRYQYNITMTDPINSFVLKPQPIYPNEVKMTVTANGKVLQPQNGAYNINVLPSVVGDVCNPALTEQQGNNVITVKVENTVRSDSKTYTLYLRTVNDNTLAPQPSATAANIGATAPTMPVPSGESPLNDVIVSSFKGGRLEPYRIKLDQPIDVWDGERNPTKNYWTKKDLSITMDWSSSTSKDVYISPVTTDPAASCTINGNPARYPVPNKYTLSQGENKFTIVVINGAKTSTYTLTINAVPLWSGYKSWEIEPGVFRIQDASGFTTNEDQYLFIGKDKAMLFDTGMGNGDLYSYVRSIIKNDALPIEVVLTHLHGDHIGKVTQFNGSRIYWPQKDSTGVPASADLSKYAYINDGDIITGPKINDASITFECIEVMGHTNGSMTYLYDNKVQGKLQNSYLVAGDAVGSGSYVFNFGANKPPVTDFARDLKKLEAKIAKFADGFYDANKNVSYSDVHGLYFLSGHSWQEVIPFQIQNGVAWFQSSPLQKLAGIEMVRDMRIAAEKVVSGELKGRQYTRISGGVVDELRQLFYRQAGLWYNGWDVVPETASLDYFEVFSNYQNHGLIKPAFNAYTKTYTATLAAGDKSLKVWAVPMDASSTIKINGHTVAAKEVLNLRTAGLDNITIEVSNGASTSTYTVKLLNVPTVSRAVPTASVKKTNGNQNELTINVTELYSDGSTDVITTTLLIDNNAAGTYYVESYKVYVDTKGNTQIRECYIAK